MHVFILLLNVYMSTNSNLCCICFNFFSWFSFVCFFHIMTISEDGSMTLNRSMSTHGFQGIAVQVLTFYMFSFQKLVCDNPPAAGASCCAGSPFPSPLSQSPHFHFTEGRNSTHTFTTFYFIAPGCNSLWDPK